jgi:hypothetical protein
MNYRAPLSALLLITAVGAFAACTLTVTPGDSRDGGTNDSSVATGDSSIAVGDGAVATDSGGGGTCGANILIGSAACTSCVQGKCCAELQACYGADGKGNSSCAQLSATVDACDLTDAGASCVNDAIAQFTDGVAAYNVIVDCRDANCAAECQ